ATTTIVGSVVGSANQSRNRNPPMTRLNQDIRRTVPAPSFISRIFWAILLGGLLLAAVTMAAHAETLNELRTASGLGPLRADGGLTGMASAKARDLARASTGRCTYASLNHDGFMTERGPFGAMAENVSCGCGNATCAIAQWMRSAGHRRNILLA